jgi:hypothetical protein
MLNGYRAVVNTTRLAPENVSGKMSVLDEDDRWGFQGHSESQFLALLNRNRP